LLHGGYFVAVLAADPVAGEDLGGVGDGGDLGVEVGVEEGGEVEGGEEEIGPEGD